MLFFSLQNFTRLRDPISKGIADRIRPYLCSRSWYNLNKEFEGQVGWAVSNLLHNDLLLIHWPLPHWPYVMNPNGTY